MKRTESRGARPTASHKVDLAKGTMEVQVLTSNEPKGPDEVERLLKINKKDWVLSQYWNKQKKDYWVVSALLTRKKQTTTESIEEVLRRYKPQSPGKIQKLINRKGEPTIGVLSIQDAHFGKLGNAAIKKLFVGAAADLIGRAYKNHKLSDLVLILGGDLLNADTFTGTTTGGTLVENEGTPMEAYELAFSKCADVIQLAAEMSERVHVVYIPGNHDRLSSFHLMHGLQRVFQKWNGVQFHADYDERKVVVLGNVFIGTEHGDTSLKLSPLTFATEFAKQWGSTEFRVIYTGHTHKKKTVEYVVEDEINGLEIKTMPSLCSTDYYHKHNKWTGNKKRAVLDLYSYTGGQLGSLVHIPKQ